MASVIAMPSAGNSSGVGVEGSRGTVGNLRYGIRYRRDAGRSPARGSSGDRVVKGIDLTLKPCDFTIKLRHSRVRRPGAVEASVERESQSGEALIQPLAARPVPREIAADGG